MEEYKYHIYGVYDYGVECQSNNSLGYMMAIPVHNACKTLGSTGDRSQTVRKRLRNREVGSSQESTERQDGTKCRVWSLVGFAAHLIIIIFFFFRSSIAPIAKPSIIGGGYRQKQLQHCSSSAVSPSADPRNLLCKNGESREKRI